MSMSYLKPLAINSILLCHHFPLPHHPPMYPIPPSVSPNVDHTTLDGTRFIVFGGSGEATDSFSSDVSLQFVFRPPPTSSSGHTTSWFQVRYYSAGVSQDV